MRYHLLKTPVQKNSLEHQLTEISVEPMTNIQDYMAEVLDCVWRGSGFPDAEFMLYEEDTFGGGFNISDTISKGVPKNHFDDFWKTEYEKTCVYNPNNNPLFLSSNLSTFVIRDFMSLDDYEKTRNFIDVVQPNGYYYSMVTFLKHQSTPLGQICLFRPKERGDFTSAEIGRMESACNSVKNKLIDYKRLAACESGQNLKIYRNVLEEVSENSKAGTLCIDKDYNLLFMDERASELLSNMIKDYRRTRDKLSFIIGKIGYHCGMGIKNFNLQGEDNKTYHFTMAPYYLVRGENVDVSYLVHISGDNNVEEPYIVATGDAVRLTKRQMEIAHLIAAGKTTNEIARDLHLSEGTVRKHVENIRHSLGGGNRVAMMRKLNLL